MVRVASHLGHSPQHTKAILYPEPRLQPFGLLRADRHRRLRNHNGGHIEQASRLSHSSPGRGTTTVRSRSIPNPAAASSPRSSSHNGDPLTSL